MRHIGDIAAQAAEELREEHLALEQDNKDLFADDQPVVSHDGKGMFRTARFQWRKSDQAFLDEIRRATHTVFMELFDYALSTLDTLYEQMRVPRLTAQGEIARDSHGRIVWEVTDSGAPIEDWDRLDGSDIERFLFDLGRLRLHAATQVNDLLMDAMFAKRVYNDAHYEAYQSVMDGTIEDRKARANRETRPDNYHAFFRYALWTTGDTFLKELINFQKVAERVRDWRIRAQPR